jgi:hypothetical protein
MTKRIPNVSAAGALGIYDGQQRAGTVIRQNGEFFAFDAEGKCIGTFDTMIEATPHRRSHKAVLQQHRNRRSWSGTPRGRVALYPMRPLSRVVTAPGFRIPRQPSSAVRRAR